MWNHPRLSEWAECNHKGPYKRETGKLEGEDIMQSHGPRTVGANSLPKPPQGMQSSQ